MAGGDRPLRQEHCSIISPAFRFTGDVHAMPEGTVFFADEPILRVTAPMPQAQFVETRADQHSALPDADRHQGGAHGARRAGQALVDFGLRRAHGAEAGLMAARASYIAGFAGTATVLAEQAVRHPDFRHHGALLRAVLRRRGARRSRFRPRRDPTA